MGLKLPSINIGRFLRTTVAPLIPGGADVAERTNQLIKDIKQRTSAGANVVQATEGAVRDLNVEEKKKQWVTWGILAGAAVLVFFLLRRRG